MVSVLGIVKMLWGRCFVFKHLEPQGGNVMFRNSCSPTRINPRRDPALPSEPSHVHNSGRHLQKGRSFWGPTSRRAAMQGTSNIVTPVLRQAQCCEHAPCHRKVTPLRRKKRRFELAKRPLAEASSLGTRPFERTAKLHSPGTYNDTTRVRTTPQQAR